MHHMTMQKILARMRKKAGKLLVASAAACSLLMTNVCLAEESGPEPPPSQEAAIHQPEPAPETDGTLEGEGMLSPSSDSEGSSVFQKNSSSEERQTDEKMQALISQVQSGLPGGNGSWSVYLWDSVNNSEGSINDHQMQAASLIKLYIMGAVYEDYDNMVSRYGDSVYGNLVPMITVSDNDAANTLVSYLGGGDSAAGMQAVNQFCANHGYVSTHMGRLLLHSNEYDDNYTSVSDCGRFLSAVYDDDSTEYDYADEMFELLCSQQRRNKIPAQMPAGAHVANKTGELSNVENDAGIIYDSSNDVVLVFMSENLADTGSAQNTIASLSRQIYDYYCSGEQ